MRPWSSHFMHLLASIIFAFLSIGASVQCQIPAGTIRLLLLGDVGYEGSPVNTWLEEDLIIEYTQLPLAQLPPGFDPKRSGAIYVPRTLDSLLRSYDMVIICEEEHLFVKWISGRQIDVIYHAVLDCGLPLFNTAPNEADEESHWAACVLSELMPHDYSSFHRTNQFFQIRVVEDHLPPVFTTFKELGIEEYEGGWLRQLLPRQGSTVWAWAYPMRDHPFFLSWEIGVEGAATSVAAHELDEPWWGSDKRGTSSGNPYGGDLLLNIVYWSVGKHPVDNLQLVHAVRRAYRAFKQERMMILSLVEFIDKMGANGRLIEKGMDEILPYREEAKSLYSAEEYDQALGRLAMAKEAMGDLRVLATKLRKRAMVWIYLVEWFTITGTSMVSVFLLWTLMVRRTMYREVKLTRAR